MPNAPVAASATNLPEISRRSFLRKTANITSVAAASSFTIAASAKETSEERVRRAWNDFCEAMHEIAGNAEGWIILGAGQRWQKLHPNEKSGPFIKLATVHYEMEPIGKTGKLFRVERHRDIGL